MHEIHHDDKFYPEPMYFDAFRFSRPFEVRVGQVRSTSTTTQRSATAGDDKFLAFGYGRHMCPGRFFAINEMKVMLATMLQNYDIRHMTERPKRQNVLENMVPFKSTTIFVRKRIED